MVLLQIRAKRWPNLLLLVAALGLATAFVWIVFVSPPGGEASPDTVKVIFGFFTAVCLFLAYHFGRRLVSSPPVLELTDEGFTYEPAGVSTGLIRWADIHEVREETVRVGRGYIGRSPVALAVVLKDPDGYKERFPAVLRPLFDFREEETDTPLLLDPTDFGSAYARAKALMEERIRMAAGG